MGTMDSPPYLEKFKSEIRKRGNHLDIYHINQWLTASVTFHDFLHIFGGGRVTGTATLKVKLLQNLAALREEVLYMIFLYLHKAYYALDRSR